MTTVKGRKIPVSFAQTHSLSKLVQDNRGNQYWKRKMAFDTLSRTQLNELPTKGLFFQGKFPFCPYECLLILWKQGDVSYLLLFHIPAIMLLLVRQRILNKHNHLHMPVMHSFINHTKGNYFKWVKVRWCILLVLQVVWKKND